MQDPQDAFDAFGPEAPHVVPPPGPAVLIVTVRRGRMLDALIPPALIALAAGLVLTYRGVQNEWDGLSLPWFTTVARAEPVAPKAPPRAPKVMTKVAAAPVPQAPPVVAPADPVPMPLAVPETKLTDAAKAKVWDDIELEARRTREQLAELERVKVEEDARAAAAPPPIDRKAHRVRAAVKDINAILKAQEQMHRRMAERQIGEMAGLHRRQVQQLDGMRRGWMNGGGLPNRMGGRPGVPFPPRPVPPAPRHEAFADPNAEAPGGEPQVHIEFRHLTGPGNLQGYVFRRQTTVNAVGPPPLPRPIDDADE
jgi:hypothetical protein